MQPESIVAEMSASICDWCRLENFQYMDKQWHSGSHVQSVRIKASIWNMLFIWCL